MICGQPDLPVSPQPQLCLFQKQVVPLALVKKTDGPANLPQVWLPACRFPFTVLKPPDLNPFESSSQPHTDTRTKPLTWIGRTES
jgi:hypothetical protein